MRRRRRRIALTALAAAALALASVPAVAVAGKGGNGDGMNTATISFANPGFAAPTSWPSYGSEVSFSVNANIKDSDVYKLWVANKCTQNGAVVYAEYLPVQNWLSGPFTLSWPGGGAAQCTAYVWLFPSSESALRGGSMSYSASP